MRRSPSAPPASAARGRTRRSTAGRSTGIRSPPSSTAGGSTFPRSFSMKIKMTCWIACGLAAALSIAPALAQTIDRQAALDSLVAAEKAFAKDAAEKGPHDSFLDFLADDGVMFTPDPVNGKEWLRGHPAQPGLLSWFPVYSEVSLAGDLGYNTGP